MQEKQKRRSLKSNQQMAIITSAIASAAADGPSGTLKEDKVE